MISEGVLVILTLTMITAMEMGTELDTIQPVRYELL